MSYNRGKVKKGKSNVNVIKTPFGDMPFYINPNKDKGIKATKVLNELAAFCEKNVYPTADKNEIKAGFELNPALFKWEYIVDYKNSRLVMTEDEDGIYLWMYFGNADKMKADFEAGIMFSTIPTMSKQVIQFLMGADLTEKGEEFSFKAA